MRKGLRIVMLLTDAYGGYGGIAKFNQDFLLALDSCCDVERVYVLPRLIPQSIEETVPEAIVYDRRAAHGKLAFTLRVAYQALYGNEVDLIICGHMHLLPAAWPLARLKAARLALVVHGIEAWTPTPHRFANRFAQTVDAFISGSRYTAERFISWSKVPMERGVVLQNCVDLDRFKPQGRDPGLMARYDLRSGKLLLTVARLAPDERYKGIDEVIEVMPQLIASYPDLKYLVVGDGGDRQRLEAKAESFGLAGRVIFAGRVSEAEKVAHYNLADVYVMPSRGEGFGIAYIEAAACGVPVVGGNAGGSREALLNGRLGRLVDPGNPVVLMEAIVSALDSGQRGARNPLIETYGVNAYNSRLSTWCHQQASIFETSG
jgi:phosphatidylinositol alpha-1,6-mannosyltransferase